MSAVGRIGNSSGWLRSEVPLEASDGGTDVGSEGGVGGEGSGEGVEGGEGGQGGAEGGEGGSAGDGGGRGGGSSGGGMSPLPRRPIRLRTTRTALGGAVCGNCAPAANTSPAERPMPCSSVEIFVRCVAPMHARRAAARRARSALLLTAGRQALSGSDPPGSSSSRLRWPPRCLRCTRPSLPIPRARGMSASTRRAARTRSTTRAITTG